MGIHIPEKLVTWAHKTQDEDKQKTQHNTRSLNNEQHGPPPNTGGDHRCS